jgi:hypothetical protein
MAKKYINATNIKYSDIAIGYLDDSSATQVYCNGLVDFYKLVTHLNTKESTFQGVPADINLFKVLDGLDCKLEKLNVFSCSSESFSQSLAQSNQSKHIQIMELHDTNNKSPNNFSIMTALITLTLDLHKCKEQVNLTDCLNSCPPTLKSFSLDCPNLEVDVFCTQLSFIETLKISCNYISKSLGEIISTLFPKLVELDPSGNIFEHTSIMLHSQCFKKASIYLTNPDPCTLIFKSPNHTKPQYYQIGEHSVRVIKYEEIVHLPILSLTCLTKKILDLSSMIVIE